jgi:hypothetical protein
MYRVKRQRDHGARRREGREAPVLPAGFLPPKQERLTLRLLELLSNMGDHDTPAAEDREAVASG